VQDKEQIREMFRKDMLSKGIKANQIENAFCDNSEKTLD
jgi:hypothetical protein